MDDVLRDGVVLFQAEELSDVVGSLGTKSSGNSLKTVKSLRSGQFFVTDVKANMFYSYLVGESFDLGITLLDDHEVEDGEIVVDNATSDGLSLTLTGSAGSVARLALGEEELNSTNRADT